MKIFITAILFSLLTCLTSNAETYAEMAKRIGLPIRTLAQLKGHCLARVDTGRIVIYSGGNSPYQDDVFVTGMNGDEEVLKKLGEKVWSFEITNFKTQADLSLELSANGITLFQDSKSTFWMTNPDGSAWLEDSTLQRNLVEWPGISVPGATSTTITVTDIASGQTETAELEVVNGIITYPSFAVENQNWTGEVVVTFTEIGGGISTLKFGLDGIEGSNYQKPPTTQARGSVSIGGKDGIFDWGINPTNLQLAFPTPDRIKETLIRFESVADKDGNLNQVRLGEIIWEGTPTLIIGILYRARGPQQSPWNFFAFKSEIVTTFTAPIKYDMVYVLDMSQVPLGTKIVSFTNQ